MNTQNMKDAGQLRELSETVIARLDTALSLDLDYDTAEAAFYRAMNKVGKFDADLEHELDAAWVDVFMAIKRLAWLDGWACGQDVEKLIFSHKDGAQ